MVQKFILFFRTNGHILERGRALDPLCGRFRGTGKVYFQVTSTRMHADVITRHFVVISLDFLEVFLSNARLRIHSNGIICGRSSLL
ncbi:MAG: hypothetical protein HQ551_03010 [Desulfobacteraceae bacterium]|nr:hypothetical protein [Desulfobacteraceae bacterium]